MLPKKRRLTTKLLNEVMISGRIFHSPVLSLKAIKVSHVANGKKKDDQKDTQKSLFAAIASKKYFKTAVLRNTMRRQIYDALIGVISRMDEDNKTTGGNVFHCIIMLKPTVLELNQTDLKQAIHEIFVKSRIIT